MTLPELDARLADRFALLIGGDRTAPDRHRTLLAVIEWSRRLLTPVAADGLATLAIFPDGFTAESATLLLGGDATEVLTELVDQSLLTFVEQQRGGRYRMLETVREFGLRHLAEQGRMADSRAALDAWALVFARRAAPGLLAGMDPTMSRTVADEEETLLAVLRGDGGDETGVAVGALLAEFWIYRGEFEPIIGALPTLLAAGRRKPRTAEQADEAVRALALAASLAMIAGQPSAARALVLLRRVLGDDTGQRGFWRVFARNLILSRDQEAGVAALDRLTTDEDPLVAAFAHLMRAQLEENQGATTEAIADLVTAETLAVRHGYTWFRYLGRINLVSLRSQRGEHVRALAMARQTRQEITRARRGDRPPPAGLADRRERDHHRRPGRGRAGVHHAGGGARPQRGGGRGRQPGPGARGARRGGDETRGPGPCPAPVVGRRDDRRPGVVAVAGRRRRGRPRGPGRARRAGRRARSRPTGACAPC